jgi:NAD-dependent SIR2 family protein deacetylase
MNKTVYFLGAGFSADAGGPIQNQIIQFILDDKFIEKFQSNPEVIKARKSFIKFIEKTLSIDKKLWDNIALEDIFTPIDRALSTGKSFKNFGTNELIKLREEFHLLMGSAIKFGVDNENNKDYINEFAKYINTIAQKRLENGLDEISVITTNWDILLDNSLEDLTRRYSIINEDKLAVVDYCCYISSLEKNDEYIKPGLLALGKGGYNIKYLKLHGSMNWLHCPNCQRMYVKFGEKTILQNKQHCRHCMVNYKFSENESSIELRGNLLLPTFIKDLSNIQIQLIWQNAGIELSEASKVVFIGYSLPQADFEIRQLLSRCIPNHTEIEVVLYPFNKDIPKSQEQKENEMLPWKTFFGKRIKNDDSFIFKTVPEYVESLKKQN